MKRRHITLLLLLAAAGTTLFILSTCSAFFLPELPRTNPYDENAVVAPVENLDATVTTPNSIQLTWTLPSERTPVSLAIIENRIQPPQSIDDGYRYDITDPAAGTWTHEAVEQDETIYYGVWSIAPDGTAVGPITIREQISLITEQFEPVIDGYADSMPDTYFSSATMNIRRSASIDQEMSVILYDLTLLPEIFETAELQLNVIDVQWSDEVHIFRITQTWDSGTVDWATISNSAFYGDAAPIASFTPTGATLYSIDVLSTVQNMITSDNYGFLLRAAAVPDVDVEISTVEGLKPPYLTITYYGETY